VNSAKQVSIDGLWICDNEGDLTNPHEGTHMLMGTIKWRTSVASTADQLPSDWGKVCNHSLPRDTVLTGKTCIIHLGLLMLTF
jgi:hypothetical protein